jgi:hypothetical protein
MPYIGKQPLTGAYQLCDTITTSATATYNLLVGGSAVIPGSANNCIVSLNGVVQAPVGAFTVSGSTITFSSTLSSSDVIDFILILGNVFDIGTPTNGSVNTSKLATDLTVTHALGAVGTPSITFTGDTNTGIYSPTADTIALLSDNVATKVQFNTEVFDTDNAFDSTTNYRFTVPSGKGGKYFISLSIGGKSTTGIDQFFTKLYKNGSLLYQNYIDVGPTTTEFTAVVSVIVELAATDFVEGFIQLDGEPAGTYTVSDTARQTNFNGFRLIGV